jgi:dTDP-4-amino-4,6-dideoxygalactose transaminase
MHAFDSVRNFEATVAEYAGSKYAVSVDSCTNALFLVCKYLGVEGKEVTIPSRTYVSVPNSIIHAGGKVNFKDYKWQGTYRLDPFPIVDGAKRFRRGMYEKGTYHCLSFHARKHLAIGRGGMILTDDENAVKWLKMARFDGRHECKLENDTFEMLGWNFYMTPEQASRGMWLMMMIGDDNEDLKEIPDYPDLSKYKIFTEANR